VLRSGELKTALRSGELKTALRSGELKTVLRSGELKTLSAAFICRLVPTAVSDSFSAARASRAGHAQCSLQFVEGVRMPPQQGQYILSSGTFPVGQRTDVARVLLAEDDIHLLRLIARLLRSAGIEVETAATPSAALELISALGFDLILSDLFAPEMSGAKIVAAVRLFDPLLPIVIISGDTEARHAIGDIGDPALYFVAKPFANDALLDLVCSLIGVDRKGQLRPPAPRAVGQ